MHTINLLLLYLWFSIATSLNTGYRISIDWNLMAGVSWMGQAVLLMYFFKQILFNPLSFVNILNSINQINIFVTQVYDRNHQLQNSDRP